MNMSPDFFAKRLAAIEEEKARRVVDMEEKEAAQAYAHRLNQQIPLIVDCIENMGLTGCRGRKSPAYFVTRQTN